jgi:hypothetical protein
VDRITKLRDDLLRLRNSFALEALRSPSGKDAYEYGRAVGYFAGIEQAVATVESVLKSLDEDPDDHGFNRGDSAMGR